MLAYDYTSDTLNRRCGWTYTYYFNDVTFVSSLEINPSEKKLSVFLRRIIIYMIYFFLKQSLERSYSLSIAEVA